jgi:hypothetical protein
MTEKIEPLKQEDVIKLKNNETKWIMSHTTFTVNDFISKLVERYTGDENLKKWSKNGVEADVMTSGNAWRNGNVRLSMEFIFTELNQEKSSDNDLKIIENIEPLKQEDVIKLKNNETKWVMSHTTFTVNDFISKLVETYTRDENLKKWSKNGVEVDVMTSGNAWRNGNIRLSMEFIFTELNQKQFASEIIESNFNELTKKFSGN